MKVHSFIIIMCFFVLSLGAKAQVGESRHDWAFGANGGVLFNRVSFSPKVQQKWCMGPTYGVTARYISEMYFKLLCGIQMEVNYSRMGWKEDILDHSGQPSEETYWREMSYIQVPLLARLGMGREKRGLMGYLVAGPQLGYLLREREHKSDVWNPDDRVNNRNHQYDQPAKNRFEYGITAGLGMEISTVAGRFLIEGRYYYGLSDIFGSSKKDPFSRSANGAIVAKVSYLIP